MQLSQGKELFLTWFQYGTGNSVLPITDICASCLRTNTYTAGVHNLPRMYRPPQNFNRQDNDRKEATYWEPVNITRHSTFSRPGDRDLCTLGWGLRWFKFRTSLTHTHNAFQNSCKCPESNPLANKTSSNSSTSLVKCKYSHSLTHVRVAFRGTWRKSNFT